MDFTLDQLQTLVASPAFNAIPLQCAQDSGRSQWWQQQEAMTEAASRLMVWRAAAYAALLFDTYGEQIERVRLSWTTNSERDTLYSNMSLEINDCDCNENSIDLDDATIDALDEIDEQRALKAALSVFDDTVSSHVIDRIGLFQEAFETVITSAAQARAIMADFAADIGPRLECALLEHNTPEADGGRGPKGPGRL